MSQDVDKTTDADARAAELREELATTELRRAEEAEAEAEAAVEDAQRQESKKERKRREAEERGAAAMVEAEERRAAATAEAERARVDASRPPDPPPAAEPFATPAGAAVEGPERPELLVAAAFGGAFLFARILKKIAE